MTLIMPSRRRFLFMSAGIVAASNLMPVHSLVSASIEPRWGGYELSFTNGEWMFFASNNPTQERAAFILAREMSYHRFNPGSRRPSGIRIA